MWAEPRERISPAPCAVPLAAAERIGCMPQTQGREGEPRRRSTPRKRKAPLGESRGLTLTRGVPLTNPTRVQSSKSGESLQGLYSSDLRRDDKGSILGSTGHVARQKVWPRSVTSARGPESGYGAFMPENTPNRWLTAIGKRLRPAGLLLLAAMVWGGSISLLANPGRYWFLTAPAAIAISVAFAWGVERAGWIAEEDGWATW